MNSSSKTTNITILTTTSTTTWLLVLCPTEKNPYRHYRHCSRNHLNSHIGRCPIAIHTEKKLKLVNLKKKVANRRFNLSIPLVNILKKDIQKERKEKKQKLCALLYKLPSKLVFFCIILEIVFCFVFK